MPVVYELTASTGTYTDRDGNEKRRWMKCGVVIEKNGRLSAKIEGLPVNFDGWLNLFEPREQEQSRQQPRRSRDDDMDQDVPF